ncbi:MAG: DUF4956 domain-containing protein [Anaerolineae bacterium]
MDISLSLLAILCGESPHRIVLHISRKSISYERIDLIKPESYPLLLKDLRLRTGLDIQTCRVGKIDFAHDIAELEITHNEPPAAPAASEADGEPSTGLYSPDWQVAPTTDAIDSR